MRCRLKHRWVVGRTFHVKSRVPYVRQVLPHRTCERCGTMQRGRHDIYSGNIVWETMRERTYIKSQQLQIVRRTSSWLDRWAHTLRLRRSRIHDKARLEKRLALERG